MKKINKVSQSGLIRKEIIKKVRALSIKEKMMHELGREKEFNS